MGALEDTFFIVMGKEPYEYQKRIFRDNSKKIIINKPRQIGVTTAFEFKFLYNAMLGKRALVVSKSYDEAANFIKECTYMYRNLRDYLDKELCISERNDMLEFQGGGWIKALSNTTETGRSYAVDFVLLDEFASYPNATELYRAIFPTITSKKDYQFIVNSTPNGEGNEYARLWREGLSMGYTLYSLSLQDCPLFTPEKIADLRASMDELSFRQEYLNEFIGSEFSYFPLYLIHQNENASIRYLNLEELRKLKYPCYAFMDVGKRMDFTCIIVVADTGEKLRVVYKKTLKTPEEKEWDNQYAEVQALLSTNRINRMLIDRTGIGDEISSRFSQNSAQVLPFEFTNENKAQMFPAFRKRLENFGIEMPVDLSLATSLNLIERIQAGNSVSYGSSRRTDEYGHADEAVALVGACWCYEREKGTTTRMTGITGGRRGIFGNIVMRGFQKNRGWGKN